MRRRGLLAVLLASVAVAACSNGGGAVRTSGNPSGSTRSGPRGTPPEVRVRLTGPDAAGRAALRIAGSWELLTLDGTQLDSGRGLRGEIVLAGTGPTICGKAVPRDGAVLRPAASGDLVVGDRAYPGELRVARGVDGRYRPFAVMDLETYVGGVVPGEIPAVFPREAQRTQAILARTYALSSVPSDALGAPIVVADSGGVDQEYHGIPGTPEHREVANDAVASTRGLVMLDGAVPLRAWYHSTCGGHTAPAETVFGVAPRVALSGIACPWCTASKYYRWDAVLPAAAVLRAAGLSEKAQLEAFEVAERDESGRATLLRVRGNGATREVEAARFRLAVGASSLRSCLLDAASLRGDGLHVAGRGWGHGVGLCQMGAKSLAEQALLAEDIVRTYYPGVKVVRLW